MGGTRTKGSFFKQLYERMEVLLPTVGGHGQRYDCVLAHQVIIKLRAVGLSMLFSHNETPDPCMLEPEGP